MERETLSLLVQIAGLTIVFLFAFFSSNKTRCFLFAIIFMFFVNILAQIVIAGEGPGTCLGMIALPSLGLFIAFVTFELLETLGWKIDASDNGGLPQFIKSLLKRMMLGKK